MTKHTLFSQYDRLSSLAGYHKGGRKNGLQSLSISLRSYASSAGGCLDHPRLNCRLLHQDTLLVPKGSNCITSHLKWLMAIVGHVAGLEGSLMHEVSVILRPVFEKIDGVRQREYCPNQAFPFLQIDGTIEVCVHRYLTENVGDQQGWRRSIAPTENVFSRIFQFNACRAKKIRGKRA